MRLRLVHTLSALLVSTVLLAVLAMGAVMAWNLKSGFSDYLATRDVERLEQFAAMVGEVAEQAGGMTALQQRPRAMHQLLELFAERQGLPRRGRGPSLSWADEPSPPQIDGPRGPGRKGKPGEEGFDSRVAVLTVRGEALIGRRLMPANAPMIDRPIRVHGQIAAIARLRAVPPVPDAVETRFLRSQYIDIVLVAAVLLTLALGLAWWFARRWVRSLNAVQEATARIARGEFDVRVSSPGSGGGDEIADVVRNINQMAMGLERLESGRRRWVANVSHELRTPLTVLRGEIEALIDGVRPLRPQAMLSLRDEALRLNSLVDDLHLLAMSDLQALPCKFEDLDAGAMLQSLFSRFGPRAEAAGISLRNQMTTNLPIMVRWDSARVQQLLSNLMENSLRYTDSPGFIACAVRIQAAHVMVEIDDSAPGVPESALPHLFEPLYRADAARSRLYGGSGLGLSICEAIARSHGGRISATLSALGGLSVRVELPLQPPCTQLFAQEHTA